MKYFLFSLCIVVNFCAFSQFDFESRERELSILLDSLRASKTDLEKSKWNTEFKKQIEFTLNEPTIFQHQFTLLTTVGFIDSPDKKLKIVNWNVEKEDGTQDYFAFVLHRDLKKGTHKVIELIDNSLMLPGKPEDVLEASNWYGALYYQIIPITKNNKTYYTVLGWDGGTSSSNTKLIDVITFSGSKLKLGSAIFKFKDQILKRVFFEHSEKAVMSLRYEEQYDRIIFDHLSPETPTMEGFYDYYVPDMTYDAFVFEDNKWILKEDVIGINSKQEKVHEGTLDSKTGDVSVREVESEWIDPTTGAPGGKDAHVAVMPDDKSSSETKGTKKTNEKKTPLTALDRYEQKKRHKKEKTPEDILNKKKRK